jgi:hypothetical protein
MALDAQFAFIGATRMSFERDAEGREDLSAPWGRRRENERSSRGTQRSSCFCSIRALYRRM